MKVDPSFDAFVRDGSAGLTRLAYLLTGDRGHAEDLVQTALLRTARRWSRARDAPTAYARQALVNLSRDRLRSLFRRPREAPLPPDADTLHATGDGYREVTDRRVVVQALAGLPVRQRQVVVLRYFEDLPVDQVAALLGVSSGAVKTHTSRALSRLRELLSDLEVSHEHR